MERIPDEARQSFNVTIATFLIDQKTLPERFIWNQQLSQLKETGGMETPREDPNRREVEWLFGKKTGVIFSLWQHMKS